MRLKLVFPPPAGPTYLPLGIAYLNAVALRNGVEIGVFDANIELWNHICSNDGVFNALRNFCHAPSEIFFRQDIYSRHFQHMPEVRQQLEKLEDMAKMYLEKDELSPELEQLLFRHGMRINFGIPETVAFSVMYPSQLTFVLAQTKYLSRSGADFKMIIGGAAMSAFEPLELLETFSFIDAIFTGEGEIPFELYLKGVEYSGIPGCFYRDGQGTVQCSGRSQYVKQLSEVAVPDFSCFEMYLYFNPVPVMPMLGNRGCQWRRCSFCVHNNSFGPHRARQPADVVREMQELREVYGCRHFYFADQYVAPAFLDALSDAIISAKFDCAFQIMARTIREYTPALLEKASAAGCRWISWGLESGSAKLLEIMNKGTRPAESFEVIKSAHAAGISNLLMMIFGAPGSNQSCLEDTLSFLSKIYPYADSMTASAFVLFENTAFSRNAAGYGLEILGRHVAYEVNGHKIHSNKLRFKRAGEYGNGESSLAIEEIAQWERRKVWIGESSFVSQLCCEHYLLYVDSMKSGTPFNTLKKGA